MFIFHNSKDCRPFYRLIDPLYNNLLLDGTQWDWLIDFRVFRAPLHKNTLHLILHLRQFVKYQYKVVYVTRPDLEK